MARIEDVEAAVLDQLNQNAEVSPKVIMDNLQQQPEVTRAEVSAAIWRLVANRRVRLTKALRLRSSETEARNSA